MKSRPVYVYRNLKHGRLTPPLYSVMRRGHVIAHRKRILLSNVSFRVREIGRRRVIASGQKNVHAFVVGHLTGNKGAFGIDRNGKDLPVKIFYDPYYKGAFTTADGTPVHHARAVLLNEHGMSACYLD